jgi:hypothetical protein
MRSGFCHVTHIVCMTAIIKVLRVTTAAIIAGVQNKSSWFACCQPISYAMCAQFLKVPITISITAT